MIVDTQDPGDIEISPPQSSVRSKNTIKTAVLDIIHKMSGRDVDLDDTRSRLPRESPLPSNDSEFRVNDRRAQIPQWLLVVLVTSLVAGASWVATMQARIDSLEREILKLWETTETLELKRDDMKEDLRKDIKDEVSEEVVDQLVNRRIINIQPVP